MLALVMSFTLGVASLCHILPPPHMHASLTCMCLKNIMNILGEMSTFLPLKGISIPYFVERFVEPSLAFATGWNYWC